MRDAVLDAVEHGVADARGKPVDAALHDAADTVELVARGQNLLAHATGGRCVDAGQVVRKDRLAVGLAIDHVVHGQVGDAADLRDVRHDLNAAGLECLQRDAAGDAQGGRQAAGEVSAAGDVMHVVVLHARGKVCVPGAWFAAQLGIVLGARVGVLDNCGYGCAGGVSIDHTGNDMRGVGLAALGRGLVATGGATVQKGLQLLLVNGNAGGNAIE